MAGIGTFCHEFGHVLGWPDFYDTDYTGSGGEAPAMENYSLMCSGSYNNNGCTPPSINMLERWMAGWGEPTELSTTGDYTLDHVSKNKGYLINTATKNEYFIVETRGNSGSCVWDNYIENAIGTPYNTIGLLVYHVDYSSGYARLWDANTLNNSPSHECVKLVRSVVGTASRDYPNKTFFPGSSSVTTLSSTSNKDYKAWSGAALGVSLSSIMGSGSQIRMHVAGKAADQDKVQQLTATPSKNDAMITWVSAATSFNVSWTEFEQTTVLGTLTVATQQAKITDLKPATKYTVSVTPQGGVAESVSFTTEANPAEESINLVVTPSQYDAVIKWKSAVESFDVSWKEFGKTTILGTETTTTNSMQIANLKPATKYTVSVTPLKGNPQEISFTTSSVSTDASTRINITKSEYTLGEPIALSILDYRGGNAPKVTWYIDGKVSEQTYVTPTAGEHSIVAITTNSKGVKEQVIIYVTVK